uniref:Uncharacterized protein n=1 Tax=Cacopsylla melanoneura TaxID=428564 RepID=A0A8D8RFK3_9HEMI
MYNQKGYFPKHFSRTLRIDSRVTQLRIARISIPISFSYMKVFFVFRLLCKSFSQTQLFTLYVFHALWRCRFFSSHVIPPSRISHIIPLVIIFLRLCVND